VDDATSWVRLDILILVADIAALRSLPCELATAGHRVRVARADQDVIAILSHDPPDVVVTDRSGDADATGPGVAETLRDRGIPVLPLDRVQMVGKTASGSDLLAPFDLGRFG